MLVTCEICGKEVKKMGLGAHKYRAHNPEYISPLTGIKREIWNKGLTAESDERVAKASKSFSDGVKSGRIILPYKDKPREDSTKKKISETLLNNENCKHPGSLTFNHIKPNGEIINLQSSYEKLVAEILDKLNIDWIRPKSMFYFDMDGKRRRYFPDFYLPKYDLYLDPKNDYLITKDKVKIQQAEVLNDCRIIVISKENITEDYFKSLTQT